MQRKYFSYFSTITMLKEFDYLADINEGIFLDQALVVVIVII